MLKDLSLYIHIPFCKTICLYCNFLTFAHKNKWIPDYVDAVCREIEKRAKDFQGYRVETIYFGGGTPSLIAPELIKKIIHQIKAYFKFKRGLEISIECNPESVDSQRICIYGEAGVTRFSLGVQSLNQKTLWRIARPHDSKMIFQALECFRACGVKNFGTDFIMGLPGQTLKSFQKEVETILDFKPAHLSFYFLSYDTKKIDLFIKDCPNEDEQICMYEWLCKRLKKAQFHHYEVSNWAREGFECGHNKRYWEQKDYLGLGIGASSIVGNRMWENGKDFDEYLRDPIRVEGEMPIDDELRRMEYIMLRLRTGGGMDLRRYGEMGDVEELLKNAERYVKSGDLEKSGRNGAHGFLKATEKGFLIVDAMTKALI